LQRNKGPFQAGQQRHSVNVAEGAPSRPKLTVHFSL
jgi:hypothetical protein